MKHTLVFIALFSLAFVGCKSSKFADLGDGIYADIQTSQGDIIVKLEYQKTPVTVANFVSLAEGNSPFVSDSLKDKKYFDGLIFHRIIKDFMIQGGDPSGTGRGNPGYKFKDEFNDSLRHSKKGMLSMANSGPKTNGSQFFITHKATPWLNDKHTVFGEVVSGMEVVDSIANVQTDPRDKPMVPVIMKKVEIVRKGKEAKNFDAVKIMGDYFEEEKVAEATFQKMKEELIAEFAQQKEAGEETPTGLIIYSVTEGEGEQPKEGQQVMVNYAGYLANGDLFDTNIQEVAEKFNQLSPGRRDHGGYAPVSMEYSTQARLFPGFREGLLTMKVGDKVRIFMPPHLGLGAQGGGPIPPNSDLIFDVEITAISQ